MYRYTDIDGSRKTIYAPNLNELREQEKLIQRNIDDGIGYKAGSTTFNEYFEKYLELKGSKYTELRNQIKISHGNKYLQKSSKNMHLS